MTLPLTLPYDRVVVGDTRPLAFNMNAQEKCSNKRKIGTNNISYPNDEMLYNFLICDDGSIIRGRGWNKFDQGLLKYKI